MRLPLMACAAERLLHAVLSSRPLACQCRAARQRYARILLVKKKFDHARILARQNSSTLTTLDPWTNRDRRKGKGI
jgi:hypothetical protein